MTSTLRTVTVALAATVLIAACGSDDGESAETTQPDAAPATTVADAAPATTDEATPATTEAMTDGTTTTEAPAQDIAADTAAAEDALLTLAGLPDGWTGAPADGDAATQVSQRLAECADLDSLTPSEAKATTDKFSSPDGTLVVLETVGVQATERDARVVNAKLSPPDVTECLAAAYSEMGAAAMTPGVVPEGAEVGMVTASRLAVASVGDATQAIRVTIPVTAAGATTEVTVDHVLVRSGRSLALLSFENSVEPTAVETIDQINTTAAGLLPA